MSWQNQAPVTPVFNPTWLSHEIGPWNVPSIEAERSLQSDVSLSGVYLQSSQPLFSRPHYGGSVLVGPSNTTDRQVYGHWMDGDVPSYPLAAGIRHATNRGTRDRVLAPLGSRPEVSSQMHLMQELRTHPPLNNIEQASGSHFQEMRWGAGDQPGPSRRMGAYSSFGSAGVSGHRWGHISMTSSSNFNQNGSTHVSATGYTGYVPGVNFLLRATDSQGHAQNHFETRNPWL